MLFLTVFLSQFSVNVEAQDFICNDPHWIAIFCVDQNVRALTSNLDENFKQLSSQNDEEFKIVLRKLEKLSLPRLLEHPTDIAILHDCESKLAIDELKFLKKPNLSSFDIAERIKSLGFGDIWLSRNYP